MGTCIPDTKGWPNKGFINPPPKGVAEHDSGGMDPTPPQEWGDGPPAPAETNAFSRAN